MTIRVVVAEDFPLLRAALVDGLRTDGEIEVVGQAGDGIEAVAVVTDQRPDVLLLDLSMPRLDGLGVLTQVGASAPDTRVLVMTASEKRDCILEAMGAGAAGYITKRSTLPQLCEAVCTVHGGGAAITPSLTAELMRDFCNGTPSRVALGERELGVLRLVADGLTDDEIAKRLYISARTVQTYLARVRDKLGVRRRSQLARWAVEHAVV
jgi:DNA-binding NarL/FixJ family response regulator